VLVDTDCHANGLLNETDQANLELIARAPEMASEIVTLRKALNDCREVLRDLPSWREKHTRTQTAYEAAMIALKTCQSVLQETADQYSANAQSDNSDYRQLLAQHESLVEEHGKLKEELSSLPTAAPALLSENARLKEALVDCASQCSLTAKAAFHRGHHGEANVMDQIAAIARSALFDSKESPEPLAAVLAVDAKAKAKKLHDALGSLICWVENCMPNRADDLAMDDARAALQGGGL
jgi:chromosome segregation ATPase